MEGALTTLGAAHHDIRHGIFGWGVQAGRVTLLHVVQVDVSDRRNGLSAVVARLKELKRI